MAATGIAFFAVVPECASVGGRWTKEWYHDMTGDPGTQLHSRESEKRVLGANPTRLRRQSNSPPPRAR